MTTNKVLPPLPQHVAIIMDGNGRWATARGKARAFGHQQGQKTVEKIIEHAREREIKWLSLFAFSTENWQRPAKEVSLLMHLMRVALETSWQRLIAGNIRVHFLGDLSPLPSALQSSMRKLERQTANHSAMNLVFAINYSGRWAQLQTVKTLLSSKISAELLTEEAFMAARPLACLPDVDMLIRTSGELRLSNFHLWEMAYAELFFTPTLWPDFSVSEFDDMLSAYAMRSRRFGGLLED